MGVKIVADGPRSYHVLVSDSVTGETIRDIKALTVTVEAGGNVIANISVRVDSMDFKNIDLTSYEMLSRPAPTPEPGEVEHLEDEGVNDNEHY